MIRYWGQPYEGSDDEANDMIWAEQERKAEAARSDEAEKPKKKTKATEKK